MKREAKLDGLFGLGQEILDAEEKALWGLRRGHQIRDNDPEGWRLLSLHLAYKYITGFPHHEILLRQAFIKSLTKGKAKSTRGRKLSWDQKKCELLLDYVDAWKAVRRHKFGDAATKPTDTDALRTLKPHKPGPFKDVGLRRLQNLTSQTRTKRNEALLMGAIIKRHGN